MELGYPNGIFSKDIPLEGQIIRIADEYDAIVSKRQYKSHVGISDTLKIIVDEISPPQTEALGKAFKNSKNGKVNPKVVKALFKVVIEDVEYEISMADEYIKSMEKTVKRLQMIYDYEQKSNEVSSEQEKQYYINGMKQLLAKNETLQNYSQVLKEYKEAVDTKRMMIDKLYSEIKVIKKIRI